MRVFSPAILSFILSIVVLEVLGQNAKTPTTFVLLDQHSNFQNPSLLSDNNNFSLGTQGQFGAFSEIRTIYGTGSMSINKKSTQHLGVMIYSLQEGEFISENRASVHYRQVVQLNEHSSLAASGQIGLINDSYKATRSTSGANTFTPNYDIGIKFNYNNTTIASSINQLSNPSSRPLTQINLYNTYFTGYLQQDFLLTDKLETSCIGYVQKGKGSSLLVLSSINFKYRELLLFGTGYGNNGLSFNAGFINEDFTSQPIKLLFGYRIPLSDSIQSTFQPYQVHIQYGI